MAASTINEQVINTSVDPSTIQTLWTYIRAMAKEVNALSKTVMEQGRIIDDLRNQLSKVVKCGVTKSTGKRGSPSIDPHATPISGPPISVDNDHEATVQRPILRRSSRVRKASKTRQQEPHDENDPAYDPNGSKSDSSEYEYFKRTRSMEGGKKRTSAPTNEIKKKLFKQPPKGGDRLWENSDAVILTSIARPYGIQFGSMIDICHLKRGDDLPNWMEVDFTPPKDMDFFGPELAVAAYIFGSNLDPKEKLVDNFHCTGNREAFLTLVPGEQLVDDVLILLASQLTQRNALGQKWYMPTTFAQVALRENPVSDGTLATIRRAFMVERDKLVKVYIPMHRNNHWFLMIIDLVKKKLVYLDSLKSAHERAGRINDIFKVAKFFEKMIEEDDSFYIDGNPERPPVSTFPITEEEVTQQDPNSNDCGVWVCQWMMLSPLWSTYDFGRVNARTRMRIALDLALKDYNPIKDELIRKAINSWNHHQFGPQGRR